MDFRKKYINASESELIYVIENTDIFIPEVIEVAKDIFSMRIIDDEEIERIAIDVNTKIVRDKMAKLNPLQDDISIHSSFFLDKEIMKQLYIFELELLMEQKDAFRFDVWKYAISGI